MKLKLISVALLFLISASCYAQTQLENDTQNKRSLKGLNGTTIINSTVPEATNDTDHTNWNIKDWKNYMQENGANTNSIGNSQATLQSLPGASVSVTGNPNAVNSENIKLDDNLKNEPSLSAFSDDVINNIISSTTSHADTSDLFSSTVKCYITRDVPIRYKCSKTQLVYGDGIESDGYESKNRCENECYEQYDAVEVKALGTLPTLTMSNINIQTPTQEQLDSDILQSDAYLQSNDATAKKNMVENYLKKEGQSEIVVNDIHVLSSISFDYEIAEGKSAYISLTYVDRNDNTINFMNNYRITGSTSKEFAINEVVKKVDISIYAKDVDDTVLVKNIKLNYKGGEYICPHTQDISTENAGNFAYICPSGNTKKIDIDYRSYTICEDYGVTGDNLDGTFSTLDMANSICKKNYTCSMDVSLMNTEILKGFREGCIEGQSDCTDELCKQLRLESNPIINENVFDAGQKPIPTIVSESRVAGTKRPRILLREDLSFIERTAEELKDEAYKNMLDEKTYAVSAYNIEENTEQSNAYAMGIQGTNNLYASSTKRALFWVLKPAAFDYDAQKKFYSVFDVVVKRSVTLEDGSTDFIKDRILYLKLNDGSDTLKPFARKVDWAKDVKIVGEDGNPAWQHQELLTSVWKYESFNTTTNKWYTHSSGLTAEYFRNAKVEIDEKPFLRIPIISDVANFVYLFPGVARSMVKNGPYEIKNYTGDFNGSGEVIVKVTNYDFLKDSSEALTYSQIVEMIDNEEMKPIYDSLNFGSMQKTVMDDSGKVGADTQLYLYGKKENKTGFIRLFPKNEDIGKNGFIYIFAIEE